MQKASGNLTEEVAAILNKPSKGTIVFSFGSLFASKAVPRAMKQEILGAFDWFKEYNFIWKFDADDKDRSMLNNYSNVYPISWLPQVALLHDPRVKVFVSHMGMNSLMEASRAGVPIIGIPIFADQYCKFINDLCSELFSQSWLRNAKRDGRVC
jgi:UDP:flavonoid glycosyltransferase YjiC (YdhE family)